MTAEPGGARFFDEHKRDRGWASRIVKRARALGRMVVLEVSTADPELLVFLRGLDKSPIRVEQTGEGGGSYHFAWASGYENGATVRVQGILEGS